MPDEGFSTELFLPLVAAAVLYAALSVAGRVLSGRGDRRAGSLLDGAFGVLLLAAAYTAVLVVIALLSKGDLIVDAVFITLIFVVFFGILLVMLLAVFEVGIGSISRARRRGG